MPEKERVMDRRQLRPLYNRLSKTEANVRSIRDHLTWQEKQQSSFEERLERTNEHFFKMAQRLHKLALQFDRMEAIKSDLNTMVSIFQAGKRILQVIKWIFTVGAAFVTMWSFLKVSFLPGIIHG